MIEHPAGKLSDDPAVPDESSPFLVQQRSIWGDVLLCPGCGEGLTHIDRVMAEMRREDAPISAIELHLSTGDLEVKQLGHTTGMHSARRHSVSLFLDCELCGGYWELVFSQHKGETQIARIALASPRPAEPSLKRPV